jgi:hypothetical protein
VVASTCVDEGPCHFGLGWYALMSSFMGPGKPISLVTNLLNRTSLLHGDLVDGE